MAKKVKRPDPYKLTYHGPGDKDLPVLKRFGENSFRRNEVPRFLYVASTQSILSDDPDIRRYSLRGIRDRWEWFIPKDSLANCVTIGTLDFGDFVRFSSPRKEDVERWVEGFKAGIVSHAFKIKDGWPCRQSKKKKSRRK